MWRIASGKVRCQLMKEAVSLWKGEEQKIQEGHFFIDLRYTGDSGLIIWIAISLTRKWEVLPFYRKFLLERME